MIIVFPQISPAGLIFSTKVRTKKIETGGFLRVTSELGIESQQTWNLWTPWPKWSSTTFRFGTRIDAQVWGPTTKFDFFRKWEIKNVNTGLDSPRHGDFKNVLVLGGENRIAGRRVEKRGSILVKNGQNLRF